MIGCDTINPVLLLLLFSFINTVNIAATNGSSCPTGYKERENSLFCYKLVTGISTTAGSSVTVFKSAGEAEILCNKDSTSTGQAHLATIADQTTHTWISQYMLSTLDYLYDYPILF